MTVNVKTMGAKKTQKSQSDSQIKVKKAESYLANIKSEFHKITWTNKDELKIYTQIVVGATFVCGFGVYLADLIIKGALTSFEYIVRAIFG